MVVVVVVVVAMDLCCCLCLFAEKMLIQSLDEMVAVGSRLGMRREGGQGQRFSRVMPRLSLSRKSRIDDENGMRQTDTPHSEELRREADGECSARRDTTITTKMGNLRSS
jgi:hypothetical protein